MIIETVTVTASALQSLRDERNELRRDHLIAAKKADILLEALRQVKGALNAGDVLKAQHVVNAALQQANKE
jgi:hypothetical protein